MSRSYARPVLANNKFDLGINRRFDVLSFSLHSDFNRKTEINAMVYRFLNLHIFGEGNIAAN